MAQYYIPVEHLSGNVGGHLVSSPTLTLQSSALWGCTSHRRSLLLYNVEKPMFIGRSRFSYTGLYQATSKDRIKICTHDPIGARTLFNYITVVS